MKLVSGDLKFLFPSQRLNLRSFQYYQNQAFDLEVLMNAPSKSAFEWEDIVLGGSEDQKWMTDVARDYVSRVLTF